MTLNDLPDGGRHTIDALSLGVVVGTLADALPAIAALFTIIWTAIRIYESDTARRALARLRRRAPEGRGDE